MAKPPVQPIPLPRQHPPKRLDSWKEIAAHLNRSVRTAQRWEQTEGLPVYRHGHDKRDSVYGYTSEVDDWWDSRRASLEQDEPRDAEEQGLQLEAATPERVRIHKNRLIWPGTAVALLLAAAALFWYGRSRAAALPFAARDWILVADFNNQTGDPLFDSSLITAFTVSLQQSTHVNVLPRPRVQAALRRMGKSPAERIDEILGREICLREDAKGLVLCDIARSGRRYALSARLIDPHTGASVRGYLEQASDQDAVLMALERVANRVRRDLGESLASIRRAAAPLPQLTTPSLQALGLYTQATQLMRKGEYREAAKLYEAALVHDPDFAMAHAALGATYAGQVFNDATRGKVHYEKALALSGRTTERERLYIRASYEQALGSFEEALQLHGLYLKAYPDDTGARYRLGTILLQNNRLQEAVEQFTELVRVAPTDAPGFINLATSYDQLGLPDRALESYAKAFALEPGWRVNANLNHEYGFTLVKAGNLAKAREVFEMAVAKPDWKAAGLRSLGLLSMYEGRFRAALSQLGESALASETRQDWLRVSRTRLLMSQVIRERGDVAGSLRELDVAAQALAKLPAPPYWMAARIGVAYARAGAAAKAVALLARVKNLVNTKRQEEAGDLLLFEGEVALGKGDPKTALESLLAADRQANTPLTVAGLARAYDKAGDLGQAIAAYERLIAMRGRALGWEAQQPWLEAHVRLAELYTSRSLPAKGSPYLDAVSRMWQNADPELPLSRRIRRLRAG